MNPRSLFEPGNEEVHVPHVTGLAFPRVHRPSTVAAPESFVKLHSTRSALSNGSGVYTALWAHQGFVQSNDDGSLKPLKMKPTTQPDTWTRSPKMQTLNRS